MAFFQYRAADQAGKVVDGVIEADAEQSVILRLREMGCVPLRIALPSERAVGTVAPAAVAGSTQRSASNSSCSLPASSARCSAPACLSTAACRSSADWSRAAS